MKALHTDLTSKAEVLLYDQSKQKEVLCER